MVLAEVSSNPGALGASLQFEGVLSYRLSREAHAAARLRALPKEAQTNAAASGKGVPMCRTPKPQTPKP